MRAGQFLTFVAAVALGGCTTGGGECQQDFDCSGGDVCANTHECLSASEVRRVQIEWTLFGVPASVGNCGGVDRMELTVRVAATDDNATYAPVPCSIGRYVFPKLPYRFDSIAMSAFVGGSFAESEQSAIPASGNITLDFSVGTVADAGVPAPDAMPIDAGP